MPTEGLEPPWPDYKTGTLPIKWNRLLLYDLFYLLSLNYIYITYKNIKLFNIKISFKIK